VFHEVQKEMDTVTKKAAESGGGTLSRPVQLSYTLLSLEERKTEWNTLIHSP